jgi:hypothetical protein
MNLGEFRELTRDLPDSAEIFYHAYYKGCCLATFSPENVWLYPKSQETKTGVVMNPGENYDGRKPKPEQVGCPVFNQDNKHITKGART